MPIYRRLALKYYGVPLDKMPSLPTKEDYKEAFETAQTLYPEIYSDLACIPEDIKQEDKESVTKVRRELLKPNFKNMTNDNVNHPSHYTWLKDKCGIEVIDITRHMNFDLGNAIKYILRAGKKCLNKNERASKIEDLQKAIWYINDEIERFTKNQPELKPKNNQNNGTESCVEEID